MGPMKLSTSFRWFPAAARAVPAGRDPHSVSTSISRRQWSLGPHSSVLLERGGAQWSEERAPEASRFRCACPSAAPLLSLRRGTGDGQCPGDIEAGDGRFEPGVAMPGDGAERKARQGPVRRAAFPSAMGCCAVEGGDRRDREPGCPRARNAAGCVSERSGRG